MTNVEGMSNDRNPKWHENFVGRFCETPNHALACDTNALQIAIEHRH
jgi:hypothetical protein